MDDHRWLQSRRLRLPLAEARSQTSPRFHHFGEVKWQLEVADDPSQSGICPCRGLVLPNEGGQEVFVRDTSTCGRNDPLKLLPRVQCPLHSGGLRLLEHMRELGLEVGGDLSQASRRRGLDCQKNGHQLGQKGQGTAVRAARLTALGAGPDWPRKRWGRSWPQRWRCGRPRRSLRNLFAANDVSHQGPSAQLRFAARLVPGIRHRAALLQRFFVGNEVKRQVGGPFNPMDSAPPLQLLLFSRAADLLVSACHGVRNGKKKFSLRYQQRHCSSRGVSPVWLEHSNIGRR